MLCHTLQLTLVTTDRTGADIVYCNPAASEEQVHIARSAVFDIAVDSDAPRTHV